jgi:hypothetical protein
VGENDDDDDDDDDDVVGVCPEEAGHTPSFLRGHIRDIWGISEE